MRNKWPLLVLGGVVVWALVSMAINDGTSGGIFGAALGSTTFRDPIFLILEFTVGLIVRQWWQLLAAAIVVAVAYTIWVAHLIGHDALMFTYFGRILSVAVIGSAVALLRDVIMSKA